MTKGSNSLDERFGDVDGVSVQRQKAHVKKRLQIVFEVEERLQQGGILRRHLQDQRGGCLIVVVVVVFRLFPLPPEIPTKAKERSFEKRQITVLFDVMIEDFRFVEDADAAGNFLEALQQQRPAASRLTPDDDDALPALLLRRRLYFVLFFAIVVVVLIRPLAVKHFLHLSVDDAAESVEWEREELLGEETRGLMRERGHRRIVNRMP